jgi:hypothetical protein
VAGTDQCGAAEGCGVGLGAVGRGGADHRLDAVRVDLPGSPALVEAVLRDEPALDPVRLAARGVGGVPFGAGELWLDAGAEAEMGGVGEEVGHGARTLGFSGR